MILIIFEIIRESILSCDTNFQNNIKIRMTLEVREIWLSGSFYY